MLTIAPRRSISIGSSRRVSVTSAVMLVSIICRHCARSQSCAGLVPSANPALFTSRSIPRKSSGNAASALRIAGSSRMSKAAVCTRPLPKRSTRCCRRSARRAQAITRQPFCANSVAIAAPKPEDAPVTRTVPLIALFFLQRNRVDAGRRQPLLGRLQIGGGSERSQPHAMPGLAVDVDRLHVGAEALQRELGSHAVGIGAARERTDLQQITAARAGVARR